MPADFKRLVVPFSGSCVHLHLKKLVLRGLGWVLLAVGPSCPQATGTGAPLTQAAALVLLVGLVS